MANHGDVKSENKAEFEVPNLARIVTAASPHHHHGGLSNSGTPKKDSRQSIGSERSIDHSPHHQTSKVNGNHGVHLAPSTPGRSRLGSINRCNDTLDDSPAVPKFGDWDENDPNSTEGFTQIFQLVRDEKQNGTGKVPNSASEASYHNGHKLYGKKSDQVCEFFPCMILSCENRMGKPILRLVRCDKLFYVLTRHVAAFHGAESESGHAHGTNRRLLHCLKLHTGTVSKKGKRMS